MPVIKILADKSFLIVCCGKQERTDMGTFKETMATKGSGALCR